jgi:uncharacterized protein
MPRPVHFEIHADDPERAAAFYRDAFGWQVDRWGEVEYWLVRTGEAPEIGIDGAVTRRRGGSAGDRVNAWVCTIDVPSVDDYGSRVESSGGEVVVPRHAVPGVGWLVYCKDPDGNLFGMMQSDESAA